MLHSWYREQKNAQKKIKRLLQLTDWIYDWLMMAYCKRFCLVKKAPTSATFDCQKDSEMCLYKKKVWTVQFLLESVTDVIYNIHIPTIVWKRNLKINILFEKVNFIP